MKVTREKVVKKAREWIGVPVVHAGRSRTGVDCVGLFICIADELGLFEYNNVNYSPHVVPEKFIEEIEKFAKIKNEFEGIELADILVFNVGNWPHHIGIVSQLANKDDEISFIHTDLLIRKVVETRLDRVWKNRIYALYKPNGIK